MKTLRRTLGLASAVFASASLMACGGGGTDVDHVTARQAVEKNTISAADSLAASLAFLDDSSLFGRGLESLNGQASCASSPAPIDGQDASPIVDNCGQPDPVAVDLDTTVRDGKTALINALNTYIFAEGNVELEEGDRVVYLLHPSVVCASIEAEERAACNDAFSKAEIRLDVTSPEEGDVDIRVQLSAQRHQPLMLQVHRNMIALEADLAAIKASAVHLAALVGETVELPATMQGKLRSELAIEGGQRIKASFSVLEALRIAEGDIALSLGVSKPASSLTIDGALKQVSAAYNMGAFEFSGPAAGEAEDVAGGEPSPSYSVGMLLAGLTGTTTFDAVSETISMSNIGLGDKTSYIAIDGHQALRIDLNAEQGRSFDATIVEGEDGAVDVRLDPGLDLELVFDMAKVAAKIDAEGWQLDEVLRITFTGDSPTMRIKDNLTEIISGTMTMTAAKADISHTISAGMCIDDSDSVEVSSEPIEPGALPEPGQDVIAEVHPFEDIRVTMCQ